jgi:hypothetical protein
MAMARQQIGVVHNEREGRKVWYLSQLGVEKTLDALCPPLQRPAHALKPA